MAMEQAKQRYPIGIQTFSKLREEGYVYIDKTKLIYQIVHSESNYFFLSRPRRFGKSLLASTFRSYFEGRSDLFKGLAIEDLETEWTAYPVLHFDMSTAKHQTRDELLLELEGKLSKYEKIYGRDENDVKVNQRLEGLIRHACEQTGCKAVVLIDEYDVPLLDVVHKDGELEALRDIMRNFYSPLKACDPYLRFVFLTGITKFSQLSIFSEMNNIKNISMLPEYASLCGITEDELSTQLHPGIVRFAKVQGISENEALQKLKDCYDGYHFTMPSPDIYNPYSLLNALSDGRIDSYWFGSGTPTYLIEMLRKYDVTPQHIGGRECMAEDFDAPTERMTDISPLLYQSGYITIKTYDDISGLYTLDIPNREVRIGLMRSLLPCYVQVPRMANTTVGLMVRQIYNDNIDEALHLLQEFLSTVPYADNTNYEGHYQQLLYVIFSLLGYRVDIEVRTPRGRVDIVMCTPHRLYIMELKLNKDAAAAMRQINLKDYPSRFARCGLPITKVGINFDSKLHTISDWHCEYIS